MKCIRCGKELKDDALFCDNCGTKVIKPEFDLDKTESTDSEERTDLFTNPPSSTQPTQALPSSVLQEIDSEPAKKAVKKNKTMVIIAIVSAVVVIGAIVALICVFALDTKDTSDVVSGGEPVRGYTSVKEKELAEQNKGQDKTEEKQESKQEREEAALDAELFSTKEEIIDSPRGYILSESNARYYSEQELNELTNYELYLARNEIYARHGREFNNEDLQDYFWNKDWYKPQYSPDSFDSHVTLNSYEKKNADTMLSIEQKRGSSYLN